MILTRTNIIYLFGEYAYTRTFPTRSPFLSIHAYYCILYKLICSFVFYVNSFPNLYMKYIWYMSCKNGCRSNSRKWGGVWKENEYFAENNYVTKSYKWLGFVASRDHPGLKKDTRKKKTIERNANLSRACILCIFLKHCCSMIADIVIYMW